MSRSVPRDGEQGLALIHVGIGMFVLLGMSAFVLDYGLMWVARGQAQNAADAGALAGAVARAFDEQVDPPAADGLAHRAATALAQSNLVAGQSGGVQVTWDCPSYADAGDRCVRVDVFRDGTNGSTALPTFFANIFGVTMQRARATATARVAYANSSNCLKPWIIPDVWLEEGLTRSTFPNTYDRWIPVTGETMGLNPASNDTYTPPYGEDPGTGFDVDLDIGRQVTIKAGSFSTISDSVFFRFDVPRADGLEDLVNNEQYRANISGACNGIDISIGDIVNDPDCTGYNCMRTLDGSADGPTWQEVRTLVDSAPSATWSDNAVINCPAPCRRIVHVPVFDVDHFASQWRQHGSEFTLRIVNIVGFFIEGYTQDPSTVIGRYIGTAGLVAGGGGTPPADSAFLRTIQLVR